MLTLLSAGPSKKLLTVAIPVKHGLREIQDLVVSLPMDNITFNHEIEVDVMFIDGGAVLHIIDRGHQILCCQIYEEPDSRAYMGSHRRILDLSIYRLSEQNIP